MGKKFIIMAAIALFFGSISIVAADYWLKSNVQTVVKEVPVETATVATPAVPERTIVVAGEALEYGAAITHENMREVAWAADTMPEGAFETIDDMLEKGDRAALGAIELGEPILTSRITGEGARPTLSKLLSPGMRAMAIPVDAIAGVSGFIVPGDRVDIMLVRRIRESKDGEGISAATISASFPKSRSISGQDNDTIITSQLLGNVRVLAVDQIASDRQAGPVLAASATVELTPTQATLITSAREAGTLSLHLRKAGEDPAAAIAGIGGQGIDYNQTTSFTPSVKKTSKSIRVRLGDETQTHEVQIEGAAR